jgi:hypothetical protein
MKIGGIYSPYFFKGYKMPTYQNNTKGSIEYSYIDEDNLQKGTLVPNQILNSEVIISNYVDLGLTKTSDSPYFNPFTKSDFILFNDKDQIIIVDSATKTIEIINNSSSAIIRIYINNFENLPYFLIPAGSSRILNKVKGKVSHLIIQFYQSTGEGSIYINQLK